MQNHMSQITLVVAVMTKLYFMPIIRFNSSLMTAPQLPFKCCLKEEKNLGIPDICHFFTQAKFLENKIYTEKTRKLRQNTQ